MDEHQSLNNAQYPLPNQSGARNATPGKTAYQRTVRHISQSPINDPEPVYVTRERYQTLDELKRPRKNMGVATSDPDYLAEAPLSRTSSQAEPIKQRGPRPKQTLTNSARYLQTPKPGKSIFISSTERRRRATRKLILLALIAIALAAIIATVILPNN